MLFQEFFSRNSSASCEETKHEVMKMTPKEVLYLEDALSHTQFLMTQCRTAAAQLTDPTLKDQVQQLLQDNQQLFRQFYDLV